MIWEEKTYKEKMKEKIKGKGNLLGPAGMGAVGTAKTITMGTTETGAVGTIEIGAEDAAGMAEAGIPTPAATPDPSKVSTNREIGIQMKGSNEQCEKKKKSELRRKEEKTHTHKIRLGWSTLLFVKIKNPLL